MTTTTSTFRGLANVSFFADDLDAARTWYTELFGFEPYFVRDGYIEFRIGDHLDELGIIDRRYVPDGGGPSGAVVSWHVDDLAGTFERLLALGATRARRHPRARRGLHHRLGGRPVRQPPGHHDQPALAGDHDRADRIAVPS